MNLLNIFIFLKENFKSSENNQEIDWLESIFDKKVAITIPSRIEYVNKFFKSFQLIPRIFNAILIKDIKDYKNDYGLKPGEIACALSQEKVLREFIENGEERHLLLLEDDNKMFNSSLYTESGLTLENIQQYLYRAFKNLPSDWDVFYLGRCWDDCKNNIKVNEYIVKTKRTLCHHAIAFSRKGAKEVLKSIKHPLRLPIDHIVANLSKSGYINSYACSIPIFYQNREELYTTLGNTDSLPICL